MARIVLSVVAGFVLWSILWLSANAAVAGAAPDHFDENGVTTNAGLLAVILGLSVVISLASGFLSGVVGKERALRCGVILGALLLVVGIAVQASAWEMLPVWYHLSFLVLLLPAAVVGARLKGPAVSPS
jgi:hypothetical protein